MLVINHSRFLQMHRQVLTFCRFFQFDEGAEGCSGALAFLAAISSR